MKFFDKIKKDQFVYTYGLGEFSYQILGSFIFPTVLFFLTDIAMIDALIAGGIQITIRILKIFVAPLVGSYIDKKRPKGKDRFLPWYRLTPILYAIAFAVMYSVPMLGLSAKATTGLVLGVYLTAACFDLAFYTSYGSLFPQVSPDPVKRSTASASKSMAREAAEMVSGLLFPLLLVVFASKTGSETASWSLTCMAHGILCIGVMFLFVNRYKNSDAFGRRKQDEKTEARSLLSILKLVATNKAVLVVFIAFVLYCQRSFAVGPLKIYYYNLIVGNTAYLAIDKTAAGIAAIAVTPLVPLFVKFAGGTRRVYLVAIAGVAATHVAIYFVGANYVMFIALFTTGQVFMQTISVLTLNMFAVAGDYCHWKNGEDTSASIMSLYTSGIQLSVIMAMATQTIMLKSINYVGGMTVTPELQEGIMRLMSIYPAIFLVLAGVAIMFFPINDKRAKEINDDLAEGIYEFTKKEEDDR